MEAQSLVSISGLGTIEVNEYKPWFLSKGFIGPLITVIVIALQELNVLDLEPGSVTDVVLQLLAVAGAAVGMIGRALAQKRLAAR